jgi:flagellar biosynthesis/type III secretory pathway M-ring protein FliF/YscJ
MDFFKAQFEKISRQLAGLSPSQKMLTAALVAIMIMTLVWWGRYAGEPEQEPLFSHALSAQEVTDVVGVLDQNGIKHSGSGDKILVSSEDRVRAYSLLAFAKALPRGGKDSFDEILKNVNPLQPESMTAVMVNRAREMALGQLIGEFPDVTDAKVMIDATHEIRIGGGSEPRASITIFTRDSAKGLQQVADAAASLVEGAQSGLARSRIRVVINGHPVRVKELDSDDSTTQDLQNLAHQEELKFEDKIKDLYSDLPGMLVHVTCSVNNTKTDEHKVTYDPKNAVAKERETHNTSEENSNATPTGGEGGAVPNAGVAVGGSSNPGTGGSNAREENDSKFEVRIGQTDTQTHTPAGATTAMAAAVRVPYDALVAAYRKKTRQQGSTEISDAVLEPWIAKQLLDIKHNVMTTTMLKESEVQVNYYIDPTPVLTATTATPSVASTLLSTGRMKEIALGALALVSLFMVSTVVKKGGAQPAIVSNTTVAPVDDVLEAREELAGTVGDADSSLTGLELDEESIRSQQVVKQVSSLVKDNPDSAAAMVKRWLNES